MRRFTTMLFVGTLLGAVAACDSVSNEPLAASGQTLCAADFENCINPILDAALNGRAGQVTCSASGCHDQAAGSGGAFKIFANAQPASTEMLANFFAAKAFANLDNPPNSKLVLEPLQGVSSISGTHTGGDIFPDTVDACYQAIFDWMSLRVSADDDASCGFCTPVALASCGY